MNQTQTRSLRKKVLSLILAVVMAVSLLPISAFASGDSKASSDTADSSYKYNIMFLDCGRKYFSVDSIKQIIDNASAAGFNYIQLAVGNDGLRFLLDDMSLTVNGTTYSSDKVSAAIHAGNEAYYNFNVDELTQSEMDTIIAYAASKGMGVIPCVNTPGHMDAILSAASSLTGKDCSYNGSARTIDVTNSTAVAFTQALLQKYIDYFAGKGCKLFNMGADEYANDIYKSGSMGFGNLQSDGKYGSYVTYVNKLAAMIKNAGMKPMAFNDGIYFNNNTSGGKFDTDIIICYWSSGWPGYTPMSASNLASKGFKLINTHGDYYWVLGKGQCSASKASGFDVNTFQGSTIRDPAGSMFCIWADYPGAETEESVISKTADTIAAFGKALPEVKKVETVESKTVTKDNVTVTAPGLTDLTVAATDAPAIDAAAEGKVVAYNVTPATASGNYKKNGTVTLPIPEGWDASHVRGFVQNEDGSITTVTGTPADGKFTFTVPHFSVLGVYELAANAATETKTINLTVGGTTTDTIDGEYPGTKLDDAVASVVGGEPTDKPGTTTYEPATLGKGTFYVSTTANDTAPTVQLTFEDAENGQYYIKNSAGQYVYPDGTYTKFLFFDGWWEYTLETVDDNSKQPVTVVTSTEDKSIVISRTVTNNSKTSTAYLTLSRTTFGAGDNGTSLYLYSQKTTSSGKETTLTFTGKSAGTTTVTIGNVEYTIIVSDKAPDDALTADTITLEHWITNARVAATSGATGDDRNVQKISKTTAGIQSEDGVAVEKLAYTPYGYWGDTEVYYWQGMKLDKNNVQTDDPGDDETADGTTLTHIRYYGNAWQYKTADNVWHYFIAGDQLVAYYLQRTDVTKEVLTYSKDWGYGTDKSYETPREGQAALTVAVVYPDGTVSPAEGSMYASSTTIFNYWDGRDIGIIAPENNSKYNIAKITITDGSRTTNKNSNTWTSTDKIEWNKTTNAAGQEWYKETEVWNKSSGTTPMVNGSSKDELYVWSAKNTAKLVLIYLERVEQTTDLQVVYKDDNAGETIYSYGVGVTYMQGETAPTFKTALMNAAGTVIGGTANWPGKTDKETGYLPDDAYVTNDANVNQKFNKVLTQIPGVTGVYASGLYEYVGADISEDGKTLTLHYNLKQTADKTFVVDFGLPIVIPAEDFGIENTATVKSISFDEKDVNMTERVGKYGKGTIDMDAKTVTYTLTETLDSKVAIPVYVTFSDDAVKIRSVYVIPASTVYYEDNFVEFSAGWTQAGTKETNAVQQLDELEKTGANNYGYDKQYNSSSEFSLGSAMKTRVSSATNSNPPTATFTFKGTGFDLVSMTSKDTGTILVNVVGKDGAGKDVKENWIVDTFYGYTRTQKGYIQYNWTKGEDGKWHNKKKTIPALPAGATTGGTPVNSGDVTYELNYIWTPVTDQSNALYQIPVIHYTDLPYGTYTVTITPKYSSARDPYYTADGDNSYDFYLDGVRIYNPAGDTLNDQYVKDHEGYAQFTEIRDMLLSASSLRADIEPRTKGMVFVDGVGDKGTLTDYTNYGPNNEVYLSKGQAIAFTISDMSNVDTIQIGAKAPSGNTTMQIKVNGNDVQTQELTTASDMYYKLDSVTANETVVITNTGNKLLSLTTLKVTYKTAPTAMNSAEAIVDSDVLAQAPVMLTSMLYGEPQTFEPSRFEASWGRSVRAGQKATLTVKASDDVGAIEVNGVTIDTYRTRTERTGWGWWAKRVTYREFTYTMTAEATADYAVYALNSDGIKSEPTTATLTVKPAINWWHKWF